MKYTLALTLSALALAPVAAHAQAAPAAAAASAPAVGATINGTDGQPVGTVKSADASVVVIDTGANQVPVPANAIASDGSGGFKVAVTKAQLDGLAEQQKAQIASQVKAAAVPGAEVHGAGGLVLGKIKEVDDQSVTVTGTAGDARLALNAFTITDGALTLGFTKDQFDQAVKDAGAAQGGK